MPCQRDICPIPRYVTAHSFLKLQVMIVMPHSERYYTGIIFEVTAFCFFDFPALQFVWTFMYLLRKVPLSLKTHFGYKSWLLLCLVPKRNILQPSNFYGGHIYHKMVTKAYGQGPLHQAVSTMGKIHLVFYVAFLLPTCSKNNKI